MDWLKFLRRVFGNGNGMSVMQYLQVEIKPDIIRIQEHQSALDVKVAALPTRKEMDDRLDKIHERIDTKQDKQL